MSVSCCLLYMAVLAIPWWDDFPRIVESPQLEQAQAHHAMIGMCAAHTDPGWGLYGQAIGYHEQRANEFHNSGIKVISYAETYGTTYCYIAELSAESPDSDQRTVVRSHWNWPKYGGGDIAWVGIHNWFDDEAFARPYTRTHPRYGGPAMTYPDGTPATGYLGPDTDPRNSRVYDASIAKDILGRPALEYRFHAKLPPEETGETPDFPIKGLLPVEGSYSGLVLFCKDSACPFFTDYARASTLMAADHGSDGIWSDNYSAWDSFGLRPVQNAFGEWSVARFRDYLKDHFDTETLAALGVANLNTFDVRAALRAFMRSIGGDDTNLQDPLWRDPRWTEDPLWRAYVIFKRQTGTEALSHYYATVKKAAAEAERSDYLVAGNDIQYMLGWCRGDLDMVSSEMAPGWGLMTGPRGIPLFPLGRFAPLYKLGREHAQSRFVNIWLYLEKEYAPYRLNSNLVNTFYYEMLANHTLPMFHPGNPRVAGRDDDNAAFFTFVERVAPEYGARVPVEDIGIYYSPSSALRDMTPAGTVNHADQAHHFGLLGWATALGELHLQYRILPEWRCTPETLDTLRLLIIPDAQAIDPTWVNATLKPWLERGGRLIYTGASGLYKGETDNFEENVQGTCLESLRKFEGTSCILENIGRDYYLLITLPERDALRPVFSELLKNLPGGMPSHICSDTLPTTLGITLYEDRARSRFFIDLNNMDLDVEADSIRPTGEISFTVQIPDWMAGREVSCRALSPDTPPDVAINVRNGTTLTLTVSPLRYYAGIILETV